MFKQASITLPKLEQRNYADGRVYEVMEGEHKGHVYPSVTRMLGHKPKPELEAWKKRQGQEKAAAITRKAADRGKQLHTLAELHLQNKPLEGISIPPLVMEIWIRLRNRLTKSISKVYAQEVDLYSVRLKIAGRTDCVAVWEDELSIVDFKQSNRPKKDQYVQDYFMQGTFYALALYERTGMVAKQIVVPVSSPEGLQVFVTQPKLHYVELQKRIKSFYVDYAPKVTVV